MVLIFLRKPSRAVIQRFLDQQARLPHSYADVGATRGLPPPGYVTDHNRIRLGSGPAVFERAKVAVRSWQMFRTGWVELSWPDTPIEVGATVGVLGRALGLLYLGASRIVYRLEQTGPVETFGFAYGTLPDHPLRGEERFMVEWRHKDDSVWYDVLAFSRPSSFLLWLGRPVLRRFQRYFAADSLRAMVRASSE